jgi:hypothetical protein
MCTEVRGSNQDFVLFVHLSLWGTTLLWHTFVLFVHLLVWHIIVLFVPFSLCGTHLCCFWLFLVWHNCSVVHTCAVCPPPCVTYIYAVCPLFFVWHSRSVTHLCCSSIFPCMAQPLCDILELLVNLLVWHIVVLFAHRSLFDTTTTWHIFVLTVRFEVQEMANCTRGNYL